MTRPTFFLPWLNKLRSKIRVSNVCGLVPLNDGDKRSLVTYELIEFEKYPVEGQDFRKFTNYFSGIYLQPIKENRKITTCNFMALETLEF